MKMKKGIASLLAVMIALGTLAGCRNDESTQKPLGAENGFAFDSSQAVEYSSTVLAENGKSDYSIVIAQEPSKYIQFAASELQTLFREATGAELPVIRDENIQYSEQSKYISVGSNLLQQSGGVSCDYAIFKESGARLITKGNCVFLTGATDEGALYAVYDFLKILFDYEFYDVDAYTLTHKEKVDLPKLDLHDIPDIDYRMYGDCLQYDAVGGTVQHAFRLRYKVYGQGYALDGHAAEVILPMSEYYAAHPDWYSDEEAAFGATMLRQLCYTNEEMTAQFIENVKKILTEKPDTDAISLGQADINIWCHCPSCTEAMQKYGNGNTNMGAVTQTLFVNKVVKAVDEWLAAEYPGRNMSYMILAYHQTEIPPSHKDENGRYVPNAPEMVLPDNVIVQYASIYTDRNLAFRDNPSECEKIKLWSACSNNLQIYEYPAHYTHVCLPYDGLHVFADNIRFANELGFSSYYMQGNFNTESSGFTPLKIYVASKLMWDSSLDPMALAYDYIDHCYGDAAPYMREYFDLLRSRIAYLRSEYDYCSSVFEAGVTTTNWPLATMESYQKLFDQAYDAIDYLKTSDPDRYEVLFRKIMIEEMFIRYIKCSLYLNYYSDVEKARMIDEFERYAMIYGFKCYSETEPMSTVIAGWRSQL